MSENGNVPGVEILSLQGFQVEDEGGYQEEPSFVEYAQQLLGDDADYESATIILSRVSGSKKGVLQKCSWDEVEDVEIDQVGRKFGPGTYTWLIQYYVKNGRGRPQLHQKRVKKTILGEYYEFAHKEYVREQRGGSQQLQIQQQPDVLSVLERLGPILTQGKGDQGNTALLVAMMDTNAKTMMESSRAAAEANRTMMLEMSKMQMQMMAFFQASMGGKPSAEDAFDRAIDKVLKLAEVKEALNPTPPPPETMTDKIFKLVSENMWVLEGLVKMAPSARANNSMYQTITESDEFQAIAQSKQMQLELIEKIAATENGEEQVKKLLELAGWQDPRSI